MTDSVASVHRFGDTVAVRVGNGQTKYITAAQARKLAEALQVAADSIDAEPFADSNVGTIQIGE